MTLDDSWMNSATREEKEKLARLLLEEKEHLELTKLKRFVPNRGLNGEKGFQERFIQSTAKVRLVTAGNQSGKTHVGAWDHACLALGEHPFRKIKVPNIAFIVTAKPHSEGIEKDIIPKLKEVCGSKDIVDIKNNSRGIPNKVIWKSGSVSFLMSAEQDDMVFEGTPYHHGWNDEPFRREIYVAQKRGLLVNDGPLTWTCTPLEEPWMYEELYLKGYMGEDPDIQIFEGSSDENARISQKAKADFFKTLSPDEIETRWHGKFRHLSGRVFKTYDPRKHRIAPFPIPSHWPVWLSIDPHRNKPHAVLFMAISPQGIRYLCNEIYIPCTINELAYHILDIGSQYNIIERLIDTSAQEDGWGRVSAREMLSAKGVDTKLAQKRNLKSSGIHLINQLFRDDQMFVFENCVRTHREFTLQVYKRSKDSAQIMEEAEKKFDEMTDNCRYILNERPGYTGAAPIHNYGPVYSRSDATYDAPYDLSESKIATSPDPWEEKFLKEQFLKLRSIQRNQYG